MSAHALPGDTGGDEAGNDGIQVFAMAVGFPAGAPAPKFAICLSLGNNVEAAGRGGLDFHPVRSLIIIRKERRACCVCGDNKCLAVDDASHVALHQMRSGETDFSSKIILVNRKNICRQT